MAKRNKKIQALLLAGFISVTSITGGILQTKYQYNSSASNSVVQTKQVGTTTANLNMRSSASTKGKILTTLKKGTKVDVIQKQSNGWYKINANGKTGYVSGGYLKVTTQTITSNGNNNSNSNTNTNSSKQVGTTTTNLNMRSSASTKGKILTTLKKGTKVDVIQKQSNGWYKINANGKTGYVSGQYLKVTNTTTNAGNNNNSNSNSNSNTGTSTINQVGITTANLNMRSSASTKGKILTTLKKGTKVDIIQKQSNGWYKIKANGKTGYVSGSYLKITTQSNNNNNNNGSTQKPSGIELNAFASKLPSMGFDNAGNYWENGQKMGTVYATSGEATFSLRQESNSFNSVIKNCLNMLLPTGGNKVYDIVSNPFNNQTIEVDGRIVSMEQTSIGVGIKIYNK